MCPLCVGSLLYLLSGAGSAGGATALTLRSVVRRRSSPKDGSASLRATPKVRTEEPKYCTNARPQ